MATKSLKNLIDEATLLADESFDNKQWVEWINNGIDDIANVLYLDTVTLIPAVSPNTFLLPEDYLSMIRVDGSRKNLRALHIADDDAIGYKVIGNQIELQGDNATELKIIYYRRPAYVSTSAINANVDLPNYCTRALVYFACMQGMISEDEPERYRTFQEEYLNAKAIIQRDNRNRRPARTGVWGVVR